MALYLVLIFLAVVGQAFAFAAIFPGKSPSGLIGVEPPLMLFNAGLLVATTGLTWALLRLKEPRHAPVMIRWVQFKRPPELPLTEIGIIVLPPTLLFTGYLIAYDWSPGALKGSLLWFVSFFFMRAAFEELIFRGYLFRLLLQRFGSYAWFTLIMQAALFAALHNLNPDTNLIRTVNIFLGGLFLGMIARKSFVAATLFHFAWNLLPGLVLGASVSGFAFPGSLLDAGERVIAWEDNAISILLFALAIAGLHFSRQRKQKAER